MPIAACLLQGCIPPCYSLGLAALMPLSSSVGMSSCFHRARSSINNCWHINVNLSAPSSRTPQVFLAVSVLDALFQHPVTLQSTTPISMRDKAIVETFKWIAIAAVAQFAAHETDQDRPRTSQSRARDIDGLHHMAEGQGNAVPEHRSDRIVSPGSITCYVRRDIAPLRGWNRVLPMRRTSLSHIERVLDVSRHSVPRRERIFRLIVEKEALLPLFLTGGPRAGCLIQCRPCRPR